jgi:hypothetical protein
MAATPPKQHKKKVENDAYRGQPRVQLKEANKTITKLAATAATLDSDFLRKIPRAREIMLEIPHSQLRQSNAGWRCRRAYM